MFGIRLPQWHPVQWLVVIVVCVIIFRDPTGSAHWVMARVHNIGDIFNRAVIFVQNL